jgi:23S rRNA (cytidine1920-2'-O)/16S rRNA (cytidine1409-2'-O)-methyltransferase
VKKRLDVLLVERGLAESRSQAQALVLAGRIRGFEKAGEQVEDSVELELEEAPRFVSRGGEKLAHALEELAIDVGGEDCLDVGASTGGFTDCLLQAGAARVVALDVGYGDLDWKLRNDEHVTVLERRNARDLAPAELPYAPDLITVDVSFIGVAKLLPALVASAAPTFDLVALVKPQFEVGRSRVGKGGVVREPLDRLDALVSVGESARDLGLSVQGYCSSGLPGPAGNRESFIWCAEQGRPGADDLRSAALEAEPEAAAVEAKG